MEKVPQTNRKQGDLFRQAEDDLPSLSITPELIASMSVEAMEEELRQLGLDPNEPLSPKIQRLIESKDSASPKIASKTRAGNHELYCPNIRCASESWSTSNSGTIKSRRRQTMVYGGTKKVGIARVMWRQLMNPGDPIESGTYHFYYCPVCGREAAIHDRWGVSRLVY